MSPKSLVFCLLLSSLATALLTGCAEDGPQRHHVSGTVTFQGEPVPAGTIVITPDGSKGNSGPQGVADIHQGKYDTSDGGLGVVGGHHRVQVIATNADLSEEEAEMSGPLAKYEFDFDFPQENVQHDIIIPDTP